ncbi:hypothetical protein SISNIDRAFT_507539 [Sistotremastrum niveocremeum HHB9708]|uniref:Uncharacterized protein n=1 Tax=Sistotremastrum niveocremeum HHB9708 TaxID=1314777 RepID=A0A164UQC1_9AGAM|nr:hypothetical protein SISNIDRAFT_507539 [Sistotremastrum niveocremeum HHB9708]
MIGRFGIILWLATFSHARTVTHLVRQVGVPVNESHSLNASSCPGYTLSDLKSSAQGLTASLSLAGAACNAFGNDISNLTLEVTYETTSRLRVNIHDTANEQFTVPESVVARPSPDSSTTALNSDLVFNHQESPFAFWITRKSDPQGSPLFDTRLSSLPSSPVAASVPSDNETSIDSMGLVFEDQYLQITSVLPQNTNIYGLGEVLASSGFRRAIEGNGTLQTLWARDVGDPIDQNVYGSHPIYLEHRYNSTTFRSASHGVFLMSAAGSDILLQTPLGSNTSIIQYRLIGGTLDFYFLSGPSPQQVIEQYGLITGLPTWQPVWGFGFHLCRWGYSTVNETKEQVTKMREANIPLEVQWNDIDLYQAVRDFTSDNVSFPGSEVRAFIQELKANNQHYIPIVDAAVAKQVNATDIYDPYTKGTEQKVFVTNPDGSEYVGQVWPGYTVFPDWFANNTQSWWTEALRNWTQHGVEFSGIWLDMNEASSFCDGSCGSGIDISNTSVPFLLPGAPGNLVTAYPEGYNSSISGPSGNITINGTLTFGQGSANQTTRRRRKRGLGAAGLDLGDAINVPSYAIHNGFGRLSTHALATNATHAGGFAELDTHNLWGLMEEKATHLALNDILPRQRPFLISRSTFPSSGKWTGHWLGDNNSLWQWMYLSIQGILQFQIFQIPMVGADTCGFNGNTDEELCNRWMQMSAFHPFFRNHNTKGGLSQEPYRWDSVANASRIAIAARYSLLPYWYSLFANASLHGTPPVRALFMEFPDEPELFAVDRQFLVGRDILVTPVLTPNVTSVDGIFPGQGRVIWRDWWTHDVVNASIGVNTTLQAPLSHINVHIRDGAALLLHKEPAYTVEETRNGPFALLVSLSKNGSAFGSAYLDDGVSFPPGPSKTLSFNVASGGLEISSSGSFQVSQKLDQITILGVSKPDSIQLSGTSIGNWTYTPAQEKLVIPNLGVDLNKDITLDWA